MKTYRRITIQYCNECPHWNYDEIWCNKEDKGTPVSRQTSKYEIPDRCKLQKVTVIERGEAVMSDNKGNITNIEL